MHWSSGTRSMYMRFASGIDQIPEPSSNSHEQSRTHSNAFSWAEVQHLRANREIADC